jgi:branched-chain amino acid aminotransferase
MSIQETEWIWFDGKMVPWAEANVHVMTHALHYGSSVFEGIRVYDTPSGPRFFRLPCHLRRLRDSASIYRLPLNFSQEELQRACQDVVHDNQLPSAYVRPIAFHGYGMLGLNPGDAPARIAILAVPWANFHGGAAIEQGIDTCVSSWQRLAPNTVPVMAKAGGNYLSSQLIHMEAKRNGFDEGIALGPDGTISEGAGENLFLVRDGVVQTPVVGGSLLAGITRDTVMRLGADLGLEIRETPIPRETLYTADEVFLTGTAAEISPVRSVDRIEIGSGQPGPVTKALQKKFFGLFSGETEDRYGWLLGTEKDER